MIKEELSYRSSSKLEIVWKVEALPMKNDISTSKSVQKEAFPNSENSFNRNGIQSGTSKIVRS